ncbi:MAG: hypothetical protein QGG60_01455 [Anaerolineales bacterium]|jgi:hypothetical protein|nr:hypothetical protein [Anaerolineaceae bacterium]MDP7545436.1 hypothetical protein [Anaerolineales bacterium]MDP7643342.1 hypothetical protein [Anaerolineales bacterium]HJN41645.1 hypothetical protein [Anaerolineales bacterium]|tara:strand:- start:1079 stop:1474 length:396 start_codon:yes stop_codon:yes gene_type:complete
MTVFARAWFYCSPGEDHHGVGERVRQSLWASGLYSLWLDSSSRSAPFKMVGVHGDDRLELEWEPATWLRLRTQGEGTALSDHVAWVLGRDPSLRFTDRHGWTVVEWQLQSSAARWREISGNPIYQNPRRFD